MVRFSQLSPTRPGVVTVLGQFCRSPSLPGFVESLQCGRGVFGRSPTQTSRREVRLLSLANYSSAPGISLDGGPSSQSKPKTKTNQKPSFKLELFN